MKNRWQNTWSFGPTYEVWDILSIMFSLLTMQRTSVQHTSYLLYLPLVCWLGMICLGFLCIENNTTVSTRKQLAGSTSRMFCCKMLIPVDFKWKLHTTMWAKVLCCTFWMFTKLVLNCNSHTVKSLKLHTYSEIALLFTLFYTQVQYTYQTFTQQNRQKDCLDMQSVGSGHFQT